MPWACPAGPARRDPNQQRTPRSAGLGCFLKLLNGNRQALIEERHELVAHGELLEIEPVNSLPGSGLVESPIAEPSDIAQEDTFLLFGTEPEDDVAGQIGAFDPK